MKRILILFLIILLIPSVAYAQDDEYSEYLSSFDLSFIDELKGDAREYLEGLGIENFDYNSISELTAVDIFDILKSIALEHSKTPIKSCLTVLLFVMLSALLKGMKPDGNSSLDDTYSTISAIVICIALLAKISSTLELSVLSLSTSADFIYAFIPAFCSIIAIGGGTLTTFSTNASLLMLAQGLSFISANIFMPIINSFLAISVCSGLRSELNLASFLATVKRVPTTSIAFVSAMFVSVLSIKTAVSSRSDILGIRSVRFLINTVVPVIGGSISEGLLSIQSYSSLIRSSVGIVGIIGVSLVFLPAIFEVAIWRLALSVCSIASDIFGDKSVSMMINAFKDAMLLINVILILSLVTTIISIGILIAARTM